MVERVTAILLIQHEFTNWYGIWWVKWQLWDPLSSVEDHCGGKRLGRLRKGVNFPVYLIFYVQILKQTSQTLVDSGVKDDGPTSD